MPMPMTRPINHTGVLQPRDALARGGTPTVNLPPSNGQTLPYGQGVVHTVKDPTHVVPTRTARNVAPAAVT